VADVEAVDGRVAERTADAVHLIGVDTLTDVPLDREVGEIGVAAPTRIVDVT